MFKTEFPAEISAISTGLDFIESSLKEYKFSRRSIQEAMLLSEESMVRLIDNTVPGGTVHMKIRRRRGVAEIRISCPGDELPPVRPDTDTDFGSVDMDRDNEEAIRNILLHAYDDKLRCSRKGRYNFITVVAGMPEKAFALQSGACFFAALLLGVVLQLLLPQNVREAVNNYLLIPVGTVFINAIKLIGGPAVFFSILTAVARYSSFADPGRVSIRVFAGYALTSVLAVLVGITAFQLFHPGVEGVMAEYAEQVVFNPTDEGTNIVYTFVNIIPSNIIDPFLHVDTLQLIFLALLCGVAVGRAGEYSASLRTVSDALSTLCSKASGLLASWMPMFIFFTTLSLVMNAGYEVLLSLLEMLLVLGAAMLLMCLIYMTAVLVGAGVNPLIFIMRHGKLMKETFFLGSELAALPKTMRCCERQLGISPRVCAFSLPIGAVINMDGNCIYLTIAGLFLARITGVNVFSSEIIPMLITIIMLSVGAPISTGSVLLALTMLLNQLGVSVTAITILVGVNAAIELAETALNTMGDVAISLVIARLEGLLDKDVYYSRVTGARKKI